MNLVEELEHIIGLFGKAKEPEIKGKLIAITERVAANEAAAAKYEELAQKYTALQQSQTQKSQARPKPAVGDLVENMGVLWRKTETGYEPHPYCKHCRGNPVMSPVHEMRQWVCGIAGHIAPFSVRPPVA